MALVRTLGMALAATACVFVLACSEDAGAPTTPAPPAPPVPVPPVLNRITVEGNAAIPAVGQTTQLKATAFYADGTSADITDRSTWTSDFPEAIGVSSSGMATAASLGVATVTGRFQNRTGSLRVTATPPGTVAVNGVVREPGQGGGVGLRPAGVRVFDPRSGASMMTDDDGRFTLGGLGLPRVRVERSDLEPREVDLNATQFNDVTVQRIVRIGAGETATPVPLAPYDMDYTMNAGEQCSPCRMIRVDLAAGGTLGLKLKWTTAASELGLWVNGVLHTAANAASEVEASISASAGQRVVFVEGLTMRGGHVNFTLATSYSP